MTASNGRTVLSMTPKFSKALLAAGLAAALVGCGGGSSTTPMAGDEPAEPTAAEEATKKIEASYATAKSLVDALSPTSGDVQKDAAESAVNDLRSLVSTTVDLSAAERTQFDTNINMLLTSITTNTTPEPPAPPAPPVQPTPSDVRNTAWYNQLSPDTLDGLSMTWPDSNTLTGKKTTVTGLPAGWEGMDYSYSNVTATTATDEQGKTLMKNVTRMTPEIEMRWDKFVLEAAKTNRSSVIDEFLGGSNIQILAYRGGLNDESGTGNVLNIIPGVTATTTLAGSGRVMQTVELGSTQTSDVEADPPTSLSFPADYTRTTQFKKVHFTAMDLNSLAGTNLVTATTWTDLDEPIDLVLDGVAAKPSIPIMWHDIPGVLTFNEAISGLVSLYVRFNDDGNLEFAITARSANTDTVVVSFVPTLANNRLANLNTNIHTMPLAVREQKTKTSVMEFAYWASQNQTSPFTVSSVDTFVREHPDMMFDAVTDMPDKLTGMAKYNGLAAGYYAIEEESNGEFTADAMLTADFGTNTVSGMIDSFMPMTGDDDLSPWKLTLSAATFMDDGTFGNAFDGTTSGQSDGGGQKGMWNGQFLGKANPGTDLESAMDMTNDYPEAVIGNFTGHFAANDGHVEGAFGTELHEDYKNK